MAVPIHFQSYIMPLTRSVCRILPVLCAIALLAGSTAFAQELRQWSDTTGKFKIKAKFKSEEKGVVILEKEDGEELEIELKKLSATDQRLISVLKKDGGEGNPFKKKDDDPFKSKGKPGKSKSGTTTGSSTKPGSDDASIDIPANPRKIEVNWSGADPLVVPSGTDWNLNLSESKSSIEGQRKNLALPGRSEFFEKLNGVVINAQATSAGFIYALSGPGRPRETSRVFTCDLVSGKAGEVVEVEGSWMPLAMHDDGKQLVVRSEKFGFGGNDTLEVWVIRDGKVGKLLTTVPFKGAANNAVDIAWAAFIDDDRLLVAKTNGGVAEFSFPAMKPRWFVEGRNGITAAISPNRDFLAFGTQAGIGIVDLAKRDFVASIPAPELLVNAQLAFSPSGRKLACGVLKKVFCWNLETGKLISEIPANGSNFLGTLVFPDDRFLLAGPVLLDVDNLIQAWSYHGQDLSLVRGDLTFFVKTEVNKPGLLMVGKIPHPPAIEAVDAALKTGDLFLFKEGVPVKLNLEGIPDTAVRERATTAFTDRLAAMNVQIDPAADVEIIASVTGPKPREVDYRTMFGLGQSVSGKQIVQEWISVFTFNYKGKQIWSSGGVSNVPHSIRLKDGEPIEPILRASEKPALAVFENPGIPKFIQKPNESGNIFARITLGASQVTTAGFR